MATSTVLPNMGQLFITGASPEPDNLESGPLTTYGAGLTSFSFWLRKSSGSGTVSGTVSINIYAGDYSTGATGSVLATSTVDVAVLETYTNWFEMIFQFPTPVSLTDGTLYFAQFDFSSLSGVVDFSGGGPETVTTWGAHDGAFHYTNSNLTFRATFADT